MGGTVVGIQTAHHTKENRKKDTAMFEVILCSAIISMVFVLKEIRNALEEIADKLNNIHKEIKKGKGK